MLKDPEWDTLIGFGMPSEVISYRNGEAIHEYHRFGDNDGLEPLIFARDFHNIHPDYLEVSEEFRHYFNLFENKANRVFTAVNEIGDDVEVVRVGNRKVEIKLRYLKEFLAARKMALAVYFDLQRYSVWTAEELDLSDETAITNIEDATYEFYAQPCSSATGYGYHCSARLLGKKLIFGDTIKTISRVFEEFIIGTDSNGYPLSHTCDPNRLANYFGANPGAPHYLTPVFFRREVLNKYFDNPGKYSVEDGYLRCAGLWGMAIDNNHPDFVVVYLGDLGRDLPAKEHQYWKSYNVAPEGGMSEANFRRSILGQFTSPEMEDLLFKERLEQFQTDWINKYGWSLFKPLAEADRHYLATLRIPSIDQQNHFDEQVLALAKILIESINEGELNARIPTQPPNSRSLMKLKVYLNQVGSNSEKHVQFLRDLWDLRHGTPHRKGTAYRKAAETFGVAKKGYISAFTDILAQAIEFLDFLRTNLLAAPITDETVDRSE
ncbi:MAG: hypothetical protein LC114_17415 [Bryobacterales bacterium]|nr:hypothetical protein [Bryobacterales bacterium]